MRLTLGMIEVIGFAMGIKVADVMAKVANIQIVTTRLTKGGGWVCIFIEGDVAAVQAAIQAGQVEAERFQALVTSKVIPRPVSGLRNFFSTNIEKDLFSKQIEEPIVQQEVDVLLVEKILKTEMIEECSVNQKTIQEEKVESIVSDKNEIDKLDEELSDTSTEIETVMKEKVTDDIGKEKKTKTKTKKTISKEKGKKK